MVIDRFDINYTVPRTHPHPHNLQKRLDSVVVQLLEEEVDSVLRKLNLNTANQIFVRELSLDISINPDQMDNRAIAKAWANQLYLFLINLPFPSITNESRSFTDYNLAVFPNRPLYLATYIEALLRGWGSDKWFFNELAELSHLDPKGQISLILKQSKDTFDDILVHLHQLGCFDALLIAFTEKELADLYDYLSANKSVGQKRISTKQRDFIFEMMAAAANDNSFSFTPISSGNFNSCFSLYLYFLMNSNKYSSLGSTSLVRSVLREIIVDNNDLYKGELERINYERKQRKGKSFDKPAEADIISPRQIPQETHLRDISSDTIQTGFGGTFLLIPRIMDLRLSGLIKGASYPDIGHLRADQVFLLLLALNITKTPIDLVRGDKGLHIFTGADGDISSQVLKEYVQKDYKQQNMEFLKSLEEQLYILKNLRIFGFEDLNLEDILSKSKIDGRYENIVSKVADLILQSFARWLKGFGKSSHQYILENFIHRPAIIKDEKTHYEIQLSKKPLDMVLRMAGLMDDISMVPWLGNKSIKFT